MVAKNVKYFCCDDISSIENYDKAVNDNKVCWHCHHRLETHNSDGEKRLLDISKDELKALDMYYNRPASELIFLTVSEHMSLHNRLPEGKIPEAIKGKKLKPFSEESMNKMSESAKKRWALYHENKEKKHNEQYTTRSFGKNGQAD